MTPDSSGGQYEAILSKLRGLTWGQNGNGKACCPAHDDRHPSLSVRIGREGELLLRCHAKNAGCTFRKIAEALGCRLADFFPGGRDDRQEERRIDSYHEYLSEHGEALYRAVRAIPKDFWLERWDSSNDRWVKGLAGLVRPVPFHLPELLAADPERWVCVAEGEKKVLALESLGFVATCNAAGSEKWDPAWGNWFRGRRVAIFPDYDEAGYKHAGIVASCLYPVASTVVVTELFGLRLKDDIEDWLEKWPQDKAVRGDAVQKAIESSPFYDNTDTQYRLAMLRLHMARALVASCLV